MTEGGGGSEILEICVMSFMNAPLAAVYVGFMLLSWVLVTMGVGVMGYLGRAWVLVHG